MKLRPSLALLTVLAAALWFVPNAAAYVGVTATEITTPASTRFGLPVDGAEELITIAGHASGAISDEYVDLRCYAEPGHSNLLVSEIPVQSDGSFEATGVEVGAYEVCRLRAVPAGIEPEPANLGSFTGPVLATGGGETYAFSSGANEGVTSGFYIDAEQLTGGDDYEGAGSCGLADSYLRSGEFKMTATFFCNDFFERKVEYGSDEAEPAEPKESGFTVDGENAYLSSSAEEINEEGANFPALRWSHTQDPLTGDTTIQEEEEVVFCSGHAFPAHEANCAEFIASGVRDKRTIEQTHDGHLVGITDEFSSTDGQAHQIVALPDNQQYFGDHAETTEYEFPGETGYTHRSEGESVSFDDSTPAAVYIQADGAPDGDTETGRGAIVFFQPSSPAYFNEDRSDRSEFYFENQVTVPATGTVPVKYAYASAFKQAEVEELVADALTETPPVNPGGGETGGTTPGGSTTTTTTTTPVTTPAATKAPAPKASTATFRIVKVAHDKTNGTVRVEVKTTGAGTLTAAGPGLRGVSKRSAKAATGYLTLKPTAATMAQLQERGTVDVKVKFQFKATAGGSRTKTKQMHLTLRG
jgi:hypothetical protein